MKFLFVDYNLGDLILDGNAVVGGSTIQSLNWIKGLLYLDHEVGIVIKSGYKIPHKKDILGKIRYFESVNINSKIKKHNWLLHYYKLRKIIKTFNPDFVYQAGAGTITFFIACACKKYVKFIHRIANNIDLNGERKYNYFSRITSSLYMLGIRKADFILAQNSYQFNILRTNFQDANIYQIANPFWIDSMQESIENLTFDKSYIAWIGIFQYQKNLKRLCSIAKQLPNIKFKIAGKSQNHIDIETSEALYELSNLANIEFIGYLARNQLNTFLSNATLLLNTSYYEGFSNTFLEALYAGVPIFCPRSVDPDNMVEKHNLGCSYTGTQDVVKEILVYYKTKNKSSYSLNCPKFLSDNFDAIKLTSKLLDIINNE